jgi:hypothetical protein
MYVELFIFLDLLMRGIILRIRDGLHYGIAGIYWLDYWDQ